MLNNADTVLAEHLKIEERIAAQTDPLDMEKAQREKSTLLRFKEWLTQQEEEAARDRADEALANGSNGRTRRFPTFREWLREQGARSSTRT